MRSTRTIPVMFAFFALIASACSSNEQPESLANAETGETTTIVAESTSDDATALEPVESTTTTIELATVEDPTTEEVAGDDTVTTTTEVEVEEDPTCEAPSNEERFVDVAVDDPDGGLNMRTNAGVNFDVIDTLPRGTLTFTTGECIPVGSVDWWEVVPDESDRSGWVSSKYLTTSTVFTPGFGAAVEDTENAEMKAEDLDALVAQLAESYGFDDDVVITQVLYEPLDAIGGNATYDLTGLKDHSVGGYRVDISWWIDRSPDGNEVYGVIGKRITRRAICSRGVTDDGLCI